MRKVLSLEAGNHLSARDIENYIKHMIKEKLQFYKPPGIDQSYLIEYDDKEHMFYLYRFDSGWEYS